MSLKISFFILFLFFVFFLIPVYGEEPNQVLLNTDPNQTQGNTTQNQVPFNKTQINIEADKLLLEEDGWVVAEGNVKVNYEGTEIKADQAEVQKQEKVLRGFGNVSLKQEEGSETYGVLMTYNFNKKEGMIFGAEGKTRTFKLKGKNVTDYIYFRGEEVDTDPNELNVSGGGFSTCDRGHPEEHYYIETENIDVIPDDKMLATNVNVYYKGQRIFWLPVAIVSLKKYALAWERQPFLPKIGYNKVEGLFIKNNLNYYISDRNYGTIRTDYATNLGTTFGFEHKYKVGNTGQGYISYLRAGSLNGIVNNQINFSHSQNLTDALAMNFVMGVTRNTGDTFVENPNINSQLTLDYKGEGFTTNLTTNYFKGSALNQNLTFNLRHSQTFFGAFNTNIQLNSINDTSPTADDRNQLNLVFTGSQPIGPCNMNINVNYSGSNFNQAFLQKIPEVTLSAPSMQLFDYIPLSVNFGTGYYDEQSSKTKNYRGMFTMNMNKSFNLSEGNNNLAITSSLDQAFYGSGEARYIFNNSLNLTNEFANHFRHQFNFTSNSSNGFSPFSFDGIGGGQSYNALSYNMEAYDTNLWKIGLNTGYNITSSIYNPLVARIDFSPRSNLIFNFAYAYDLNQHQSQTFDTKLDLQFNTQWRFEYASTYNFLNQKFGNQDFKLTKDCHCWLWSIGYRTYRDEIILQIAIKAFPYETFSVGSSASGPILPLLQNVQSVQTQLTNPAVQF